MRKVLIYIVCGLLFTSCSKEIELGKLNGTKVSFFEIQNNIWGISIKTSMNNSVTENTPIEIFIYKDSVNVEKKSYSYDSVRKSNAHTIEAQATIQKDNCTLIFNDSWKLTELGLKLVRNVKVQGDSDYSFATSVQLVVKQNIDNQQIKFFVPGIVYGSAEGLPENAFFQNDTIKNIYIREDRCPTPMIGSYFADGSSVTMFNALPDGTTNVEDASTKTALHLCSDKFKFGSIFTKREKNIILGYTFPGCEGDISYAELGYPEWQRKENTWRYRMHPLHNGFEQNYSVIYMFETNNTFAEYYTQVWEKIFGYYNPEVNRQDIEKIKRASVTMLNSQIQHKNGMAYIPNFISKSQKKGEKTTDPQMIMGFTGKALETANFLLYASDENFPQKDLYREQAVKLLDYFADNLPVNPPTAEGFNSNNGELALALPHVGQLFLRSFSDDMKATLRAVKYEREHGREHENWLNWVKTFADFLLSQQTPEGGFPRTWEPRTGKIANEAPQSTYNAIPMLVLLYQLSDNMIYLDSAIKAGEFCWNNQKNGIFTGGTIDNPNAVDKEAGTLSLEAYLILYETTKDEKWLNRACLAADYAATWIYLWNVPIPEEFDDKELDWKKNVPTVGMQLISTGHSLVDAYMAFDADEFAKLYKYTSKEKYLKTSELLMHNTAALMALEDRMYDLELIGFQQEHWSFAPFRGKGLHRGWLPWVSTSHLNGIYGLQLFDKDLYHQIVNLK